mmetsp:Transcript_4299/g.15763  ORF Transcript_4299/g.15763 Transcript_4299/m.15763 type:complete len:284 (+) Transcript_4299:1326-2177(+)
MNFRRSPKSPRTLRRAPVVSLALGCAAVPIVPRPAPMPVVGGARGAGAPFCGGGGAATADDGDGVTNALMESPASPNPAPAPTAGVRMSVASQASRACVRSLAPVLGGTVFMTSYPTEPTARGVLTALSTLLRSSDRLPRVGDKGGKPPMRGANTSFAFGTTTAPLPTTEGYMLKMLSSRLADMHALASASAPRTHNASYALHMRGSALNARVKCAVAAAFLPVSLQISPSKYSPFAPPHANASSSPTVGRLRAPYAPTNSFDSASTPRARNARSASASFPKS